MESYACFSNSRRTHRCALWYIALLKEMAAEHWPFRAKDGLWRPGLLDADSYPLPEVSGSAFITYALAYGVNEKILDRKTYWPAVGKSLGRNVDSRLRRRSPRLHSTCRSRTRRIHRDLKLRLRSGSVFAGRLGDLPHCEVVDLYKASAPANQTVAGALHFKCPKRNGYFADTCASSRTGSDAPFNISGSISLMSTRETSAFAVGKSAGTFCVTRFVAAHSVPR